MHHYRRRAECQELRALTVRVAIEVDEKVDLCGRQRAAGRMQIGGTQIYEAPIRDVLITVLAEPLHPRVRHLDEP